MKRDNWMVLWGWQRECLYETKISICSWMSEWAKTNAFLSSLYVCASEEEWERERWNKSFSEQMCAVLCLFPRTEVWRGLIFLTAVRPGWEAETARGSCFLWGSPSPHMAFDPVWVLWPTHLPSPTFYVAYMHVCCNLHTTDGKTWSQLWNFSGKPNWKATWNQSLVLFPSLCFRQDK